MSDSGYPENIHQYDNTPGSPFYEPKFTDEDVEQKKRGYQNDPTMVCEAISETIDEIDINNLYTNPLAFGEHMQQKVIEYINNAVEAEFDE
jgi:hypothetical protein